ncbi:MAG: hypothetical protein JWN34_4775 [Bryobacterales bacterium]|jgi:hypothetical protein|nr:hypothetical protein [Bryobacterales bacterium]
MTKVRVHQKHQERFVKTNKFLIRSASLLLTAMLAVSSFAQEAKHARGEEANAKADTKAAAPSAVGAWFGIARPCPADSQTDSPVHTAFCQAVCGLCSSIPNTLPPEVPMMPTFLADGTVLADDAGEIVRYHTTGHGNWAASPRSDDLPDWLGLARSKATFFWLGSTATDKEPFGTCCFSNTVRPRFVAYFDPADPDRMIGYIQPYAAFPVDPKTGAMIVKPGTPADTKAGNHIPAAQGDLLANPLPAGCRNDLGCLGTYHFVIRRIKAQ